MSGHPLDNVARAPLFDRLTDLEPRLTREIRPFRTLTYQELLTSVRREVEELLNSRCPFPRREFDDRERSVIDYGAPDLADLSPNSETDHKQITRELARIIEAFEPRLREVYLTIESHELSSNRLHLTIHALLLLEQVTEPISFPLAVNAAGR